MEVFKDLSDNQLKDLIRLDGTIEFITLQKVHKLYEEGLKSEHWQRVDIDLDKQLNHATSLGIVTGWNLDKAISKKAKIELEGRQKAKKLK